MNRKRKVSTRNQFKTKNLSNFEAENDFLVDLPDVPVPEPEDKPEQVVEKRSKYARDTPSISNENDIAPPKKVPGKRGRK